MDTDVGANVAQEHIIIITTHYYSFCACVGVCIRQSVREMEKLRPALSALSFLLVAWLFTTSGRAVRDFTLTGSWSSKKAKQPASFNAQSMVSANSWFVPWIWPISPSNQHIDRAGKPTLLERRSQVFLTANQLVAHLLPNLIVTLTLAPWSLQSHSSG